MTNPINFVILVFLIALCLAWLVYYPVLGFARRHDIYDNPDERKLQRNPVPVLGGLVVAIGTLVAIQFAWTAIDCRSIIAVEAAMLIMLVLGTTDDLKGLSPAFRFTVQIAVAIGLMLANGYSIDNLHGLWGVYEFSPWIAWPLTIFAVCGIINAINLIDGVNGLSSGICIMALGFYGMETFFMYDYARACLALAAMGALIPFFIHNVFGYRSRMFIGDGGTMMLGILLSDFVISIMHDGFGGSLVEGGNEFCTVAFVVAVLAIPLGDTLRVMTMRILRGQSPFHPDKTHLHHAFIKYGFTHLETSLMEIILNAGIVGLWWLMYKSHFPQHWQLYMVVLSGFAVVIGLYWFLGRKERVAARRATRTSSPFMQLLRVYMGSQEALSQPLTDAQWEKIYKIAAKQTLVGIIYSAIEKLPDDQKPPRAVKIRFALSTEKIEARGEVMDAHAAEITEKFAGMGLRCCVLKGQGIANLYPDPHRRQSGDIDLWVDAPREKLIPILREHWEVGDIFYHHADVKAFDDKTSLEVHFTPTWMNSPKSNRHLQAWFNVMADAQFRSPVNEKGFNAVSIGFDCVFSLVHIYRHLLFEGVGLRQVMDYYYILQHSTQEERTSAYHLAKSLGMSRFVAALMYAENYFFGLEGDKMLCAASPEEGDFLVDEIIRGGNFGHYDPKRRTRAGMAPLKLFILRICHLIRFVSISPDEVFWAPHFKVTQFLWRRKNNY